MDAAVFVAAFPCMKRRAAYNYYIHQAPPSRPLVRNHSVHAGAHGRINGIMRLDDNRYTTFASRFQKIKIMLGSGAPGTCEKMGHVK